jgi:hypothetical protein
MSTLTMTSPTDATPPSTGLIQGMKNLVLGTSKSTSNDEAAELDENMRIGLTEFKYHLNRLNFTGALQELNLLHALLSKRDKLYRSHETSKECTETRLVLEKYELDSLNDMYSELRGLLKLGNNVVSFQKGIMSQTRIVQRNSKRNREDKQLAFGLIITIGYDFLSDRANDVQVSQFVAEFRRDWEASGGPLSVVDDGNDDWEKKALVAWTRILGHFQQLFPLIGPVPTKTKTMVVNRLGEHDTSVKSNRSALSSASVAIQRRRRAMLADNRSSRLGILEYRPHTSETVSTPPRQRRQLPVPEEELAGKFQDSKHGEESKESEKEEF